MNGETLEETSFKYLSAILSKGWFQYRGGPNMNCHGDRSDDTTEQVVKKQFHQLTHMTAPLGSFV
ncbi:hypothetical protein DPMN_008347 [Dreissena polymorpha]|uniref:Uncharacterized protein n=1 Tax=Dreissena polymorpha TaxID=45954 RepID=A0A9D4RX89_DREPO|nr:hypothetical protein DPMN_008347 [Dreissena polymorpha]